LPACRVAALTVVETFAALVFTIPVKVAFPLQPYGLPDLLNQFVF
jgi:hypothetical protein